VEPLVSIKIVKCVSVSKMYERPFGYELTSCVSDTSHRPIMKW